MSEETYEEDVIGTPQPVEESKTETNKTEEQAHAHKVAKAKVDAPMLELVTPIGMETNIKSIPMEVIKVDGMTVTFKRKDIIG